MNEELREQILDCLHLHGQAVTYGALGGVVNAIARFVMNGLPRNHRNSWVINARTLYPSGYTLQEIDPRLLQGNAVDYVIRTSIELLDWLRDHECISAKIDSIVIVKEIEPNDNEFDQAFDELARLNGNNVRSSFSIQFFLRILKELAKTVPGIGPLISALEGMEFERNIQDLQEMMLLIFEELAKIKDQINFEELAKIKDQINSENKSILTRVKNNNPRKSDGRSDSSGRRNVHLYLASSARANALVTEQIALEYNFIWRSYRNVLGHLISNVQYVNENDIIVLAYRDSHPIIPGRFFRVLNPFVVTKPRENMQINPKAPFVGIHDVPNLIPLLNQNGYHKDPIQNQMIGLPVEITDAMLDLPETMNVFHNAPWPSPPGQTTLWPLYRPNDNWQESPYIPEPVRNWMRTLI